MEGLIPWLGLLPCWVPVTVGAALSHCWLSVSLATVLGNIQPRAAWTSLQHLWWKSFLMREVPYSPHSHPPTPGTAPWSPDMMRKCPRCLSSGCVLPNANLFCADNEEFHLRGSVWLPLLGTCISKCLTWVSREGEPGPGVQAHRTERGGGEGGSWEKSRSVMDRAGEGA